MLVKIAGQLPAGVRVRWLTVNGSPAFPAESPNRQPGNAPRWVLRIELSGEARIHLVAATRKLKAIDYSPAIPTVLNS